jgi:hypothetical protein
LSRRTGGSLSRYDSPPLRLTTGLMSPASALAGSAMVRQPVRAIDLDIFDKFADVASRSMMSSGSAFDHHLRRTGTQQSMKSAVKFA